MIEELNEPTYPNYSDSILNLSCSIQRFYGITPLHSTLPQADSILAKNPKHVVVILLDGLGMNILESNLSHRDFLRRNLLMDYSSVFPPTTTASTTSFLSGKSPIEHGWLGWDVYFEQENKTVTCFHNTLQDSTSQAANYNIPRKYLPYESILDQINQTGNAKAYGIFPFGIEPHKTLHDWTKAIRKNIQLDERNFTYAYWENPDHLLHKLGNHTKDVNTIIRELNIALLDLCEDSKDTIFFITADHGHINIQNDYIEENHPDLANMLERQVSIEPRAISFYVKPEYKEQFAQKFKEQFHNKYLLFTKEEVLNNKLFGDGDPNPNLTGIGDYIAAAVSSHTLVWNKKSKTFRSHHAGLTKEEMRIPLIWYENKPKKTGLIVYYSIVAFIIALLLFILFV